MMRLPNKRMEQTNGALAIERLSAYAPFARPRRRIIHPGVSLTRVRR